MEAAEVWAPADQPVPRRLRNCSWASTPALLDRPLHYGLLKPQGEAAMTLMPGEEALLPLTTSAVSKHTERAKVHLPTAIFHHFTDRK